MSTEPQDDKPLWREVAGLTTAFIIVLAFVAIGFMDFFSHAWLGVQTEIEFDAGWMAAMLSLASTAFGYMVGKQTSGKQSKGTCPLCGK